jgi:hypothetical protein
MINENLFLKKASIRDKISLRVCVYVYIYMCVCV